MLILISIVISFFVLVLRNRVIFVMYTHAHSWDPNDEAEKMHYLFFARSFIGKKFFDNVMIALSTSLC